MKRLVENQVNENELEELYGGSGCTCDNGSCYNGYQKGSSDEEEGDNPVF